MYEVHIWWRGEHFYEIMCGSATFEDATRRLLHFYQRCVNDYETLSEVQRQVTKSNLSVTYRIVLMIASHEPVHMEIWRNV